MGVTEPEEGSSTQVTTYTPIYRFQTGQIPVTYRNGGGVNIDGFSDGNNDWMQVYFSFINDKGQRFRQIRTMFYKLFHCMRYTDHISIV